MAGVRGSHLFIKCALESAARHCVRHVGELKAAAGVGAVCAVSRHRIGICHAGQRQLQLDACTCTRSTCSAVLAVPVVSELCFVSQQQHGQQKVLNSRACRQQQGL